MSEQNVERDLTSLFVDFARNQREESRKLMSNFDSVFLWVIGLSASSIVLIFSAIDKLLLIASRTTINVTLIFLIISVVVGLIARVAFAITVFLDSMLMSHFEFTLKGEGINVEQPFISFDSIETPEMLERIFAQFLR